MSYVIKPLKGTDIDRGTKLIAQEAYRGILDIKKIKEINRERNNGRNSTWWTIGAKHDGSWWFPHAVMLAWTDPEAEKISAHCFADKIKKDILVLYQKVNNKLYVVYWEEK